MIVVDRQQPLAIVTTANRTPSTLANQHRLVLGLIEAKQPNATRLVLSIEVFTLVPGLPFSAPFIRAFDACSSAPVSERDMPALARLPGEVGRRGHLHRLAGTMLEVRADILFGVPAVRLAGEQAAEKETGRAEKGGEPLGRLSAHLGGCGCRRR
jgi:hypothetical protein